MSGKEGSCEPLNVRVCVSEGRKEGGMEREGGSPALRDE